MGSRLIIQHGERTTRHEIGDGPVVIGRDPSCNLFFADQKLSRRHARVEPGPDGVRLIDLGSRNGSWVNEQRVEEQTLRSGDTLRLGGLHITFEEDRTASGDESTVLLSGSSPKDAARTVILNTGAIPVEPVEERPRGVGPEGTVSLRRSSPARDRDRTVILSHSEEGSPVEDSGTRVFHDPDARAASGPHAPPPAERTGTLVLSGEELEEEAAAAELPVEPEAPLRGVGQGVLASARRRTAALSWRVKLALILSGLAGLTYLVLAAPLVNSMRSALTEESLLRGRALLGYLAARNEALLGERRIQELSVDFVLKEPGVKDALILDPAGRVLAPSVRSGETYPVIEGVGPRTAEIYTFYLGRAPSGGYNLVLPITHRGQRVGLAVLTYAITGVSERGSIPAILFLCFLVVAAATIGALVAARRMTLHPLVSLRDDLEAVIKGDAEYVPSEHPYAELGDLAESINRLIDRAPALSAPPLEEPSFARGRAAPPQPQPIAPPAPPSPPAPALRFPDEPEAESEPELDLDRAAASAPPALSSWQPLDLPPVPDGPPDPPEPVALPPSEVPPPREAPAGGGELAVDDNYIVSRVEEEAARILESSPGEIEGKHLIEAVREQRLLEVILDLVNALSEGGSASGEAELAGAGVIAVTVRRETGGIVVGLRKP